MHFKRSEIRNISILDKVLVLKLSEKRLRMIVIDQTLPVIRGPGYEYQTEHADSGKPVMLEFPALGMWWRRK